jgi:hypothetical protein
MTAVEKNHLAGLVAEYIRQDSRNDAAARDRAKVEAVVTYAYCTATAFARRANAAKKAA